MDPLKLALRVAPVVELEVTGRSMRPWFATHAAVRLAPTPPVGSLLHRVVAVATDGAYVVHRVIAEDGDHLVLRGDGNAVRLETARRGDVSGVVIAFRRWGRWVPIGSVPAPIEGMLARTARRAHSMRRRVARAVRTFAT